MKPIFTIFIAIALVIAGCAGKEPIKGAIFERKEIAQDKLMIKYRYTYNNNSYIDSASIVNHILPGDSIDIIVDPSKPEKSAPVFTSE